MSYIGVVWIDCGRLASCHDERTKGGKVDADTSVYVEACHYGDSTASADGIIGHSF